MSEWVGTTLGQLCAADGGSLQTGPFGSQLHAGEYTPDGIPVVMPQDLGQNTISTDQIARVPEEVAARLDRHRLALGDIVFSRRGDVTRRALVRESNIDWLCGTGCLRVRPGKDVNARFLSYLLGTAEARDWLLGNAVGTNMLNLNTTILGRLPLTVPPLPEQQAIAEVLGALDDKIAANTKLAATAWLLIEAEFRKSQISRGMRNFHLRDVVAFKYGKSLPLAERQPGHVTVVGSGGATGTHAHAVVDHSGVVVGRKGSAGAVHWIHGPHFPIDTTFYVQSALENVSQEYIYFLLRSLRLDQMNNDSAVPGLNRKDALALPVRLPSRERLTDFSTRAASLVSLVESSERECATLAATRDALLPQLMSGKLRVRDIEVAADIIGVTGEAG